MERALLNPRRLIVIALAVGALAALALACGGGGDGVGPTAGTASPAASAGLCDLLPRDQVEAIAGVTVGQVQEREGPGFLHFCTIYLNVPDCPQCALSLEDLGKVDPASNNDTEAFRETFLAANPEAEPSFKNNVAGEGSWLATATAGELSGLKIIYFKVGDVAYDITGPRVTGGLLTEQQMVGLALRVIRNLR
ncbi:MAG: hypothetical protein HYY03_03930 [Chloroflexi bacterium]|nr:hypothetical protein [Chloroflexota bacterium]